MMRYITVAQDNGNELASFIPKKVAFWERVVEIVWRSPRMTHLQKHLMEKAVVGCRQTCVIGHRRSGS